MLNRKDFEGMIGAMQTAFNDSHDYELHKLITNIHNDFDESNVKLIEDYVFGNSSYMTVDTLYDIIKGFTH